MGGTRAVQVTHRVQGTEHRVFIGFLICFSVFPEPCYKGDSAEISAESEALFFGAF